MNESHTLMDGKVHIYKRENSRYWQCSTYMAGRNYRTSTKEESLTLAKDFAQEWYMAAYLDAKQRGQSSRLSRMLNQFAGGTERTRPQPIRMPAREPAAKPSGHNPHKNPDYGAK